MNVKFCVNIINFEFKFLSSISSNLSSNRIDGPSLAVIFKSSNYNVSIFRLLLKISVFRG